MSLFTDNKNTTYKKQINLNTLFRNAENWKLTK